MIGGLIVSHGDFGESLLRVVESIVGDFENLASVSNGGLSTSDLVERIGEVSAGMNVESLFVFVDAYGGSCWKAAKLAQRGDFHIITGLNLPMLLSFIHKRESFPCDELKKILVTDGKRGIRGE